MDPICTPEYVLFNSYEAKFIHSFPRKKKEIIIQSSPVSYYKVLMVPITKNQFEVRSCKSYIPVNSRGKILTHIEDLLPIWISTLLLTQMDDRKLTLNLEMNLYFSAVINWPFVRRQGKCLQQVMRLPATRICTLNVIISKRTQSETISDRTTIFSS